MRNPFDARFVRRLSENAHLLRYPHPSSLRGVGPPGRRHCGVLLCTPHSSGFRKPCIWTFSISLSEVGFSTVYTLYERGTRTVKVVPTPVSVWKLRLPLRIFKMF